MSPLHLVHGPPGTGKTTYLARQARRGAGEHGADAIAIVSLTRAAAAEIGGRETGIPAANVGTLHAACFQGLDRPRLAETSEGLRAFSDAHPALRLQGARTTLDEPAADPAVGAGPADALHGAVAALRARRLPRSAWPLPEREFDAVWEDWKRQTHRRDFTDLVELALAELPAHPAHPRALLLDEAQDCSALELALVARWAQAAATTIVCGDADQALYQWRGSDPDGLARLSAADSRTLAQSHRVPRAVHALASDWIGRLPARPPIAYAPTDAAGAVTTLPFSLRWVEPLLAELERDLAAGRDAMVLTACGYQLAPVLKLLRDAGLPFHNPYRTAASAWNPLRGAGALAAFLRPSAAVWGERARPWTWEDLRAWTAPLAATRTLARGAGALIAAKCAGAGERRDRAGDGRDGRAQGRDAGGHRADAIVPADTLARLLPGYGPRHPAALLDAGWWASRLRAGETARHRYPLQLLDAHGPGALRARPRVVVGTIHSVKGGEADVVYLFPDLSRRGMWQGWHAGGPARDQLVRMVYVALTRAREQVVLLAPSGPEHVGLRP